MKGARGSSTELDTMSTLLVYQFFTLHEFNDFVAQCCTRLDGGVLLEEAVDIWIDQNRNKNACAII